MNTTSEVTKIKKINNMKNIKNRKTRRKLLLVTALAAISIAGCSSVPTPVVPSGFNRTPINSKAKIDDYQARAADAVTLYNERTELARQLDALKQQVAELKSYLLMQPNTADSEHASVRPVVQAAVPTPAPVIGALRESVEVRDQAVIFRVTHPFAKTEFNPSPDLQAQLLTAARDCQHIEIRGRTDAQFDNPIDRNIALLRAAHARSFLVSQGIDPKKIRSSAMAAGGNVAENKTAVGRAQNRRVEIETMDLDTTAFNTHAPIPSSAMTLGSQP